MAEPTKTETKTEVNTTVIITDLIPGDPPALVTIKHAVNSQGAARHITQKIFVRDNALAQRLFTEARRGDAITLTLTTTWTAESYETDLTDFAFSGASENAPHEKVLASHAA